MPAPSRHLPEPPSSFVGREAELAALGVLLERGERLVTVLGPGGVGKTRLSVRFAREVAFPSVAFCDLTDAATLRDFCSVVCQVLGVALAPGATPEDALVHLGQVLATRRASLLVLDNLEQLVAEVAPAIARLIERAPELRVLATSRERLRVRGEVVLDLAPLAAPPPGDEAPERFASVKLFQDRARAVAPGWGSGPGDAAVIAAIVRRLEGFPLAIELCATRGRLLDPATLLARLAQSFEVLAAGPRDAADRHRTLEHVFAWSERLLSSTERAALAQCSVFAGGFTLESAEEVLDLDPGAPPVLDVLEALVDKSLLRAQGRRFSLYSAIRDRAARALGAGAVAAEERHARYVLARCEHLAARVEHGDSEAADELAAERENIAAVHARALSRPGDPGQAAVALRAALVLDEVLGVRGPFQEHFVALDAAVGAAESTAVDPRLLARALEARGRAHHAEGRASAALDDLERALAAALREGDRAAEARARASLCVARRVAHRLQDARSEGERALALFRELGLVRREIFVLGALAAVDLHEGRVEEAAAHFARVETVARRVGDARAEAMAVAFLGHVHQERGALSEARTAFERAVTLFGAAGDARHEAIFAGYVAGVVHEEGDVACARDGYERAAARLRVLGSARFEGLFRACLGAAAATLGRLDEARAAGDVAAEILASVADPALLLALALHRLHLDAVGPSGAAAALATSRALVEGSPYVADSDDVRFALRLVHRALAAAPPVAAPALRAAADGRWFEPAGGARVSLDRRRPLRLVLSALVEARLRAPGRALDWQALLATGWPGQRVRADAGAHRVRVAVATLRSLGLRALIQSRDDGYLLDPSAVVDLARV